MARKRNGSDLCRRRLAIGGRVREARESRSWSQAELARRLAIPQKTLCNYEAGQAMPAEVALALLEVADLAPSWLLHGRGPMSGACPTAARLAAELRSAADRLDPPPVDG
jgi:transcriptional regulator with XRE-family HTH domain